MSHTLDDVLTVTVVVFDKNTQATTTLYFASTGFSSSPTDTPAHTHFQPRVEQAMDITRTLFGPKTTKGRSTVGLGDVVLLNGDGALDDFTDRYAVDGRAITVRRGALGAAYPGGFTTDFVGTMSGAEVTTDGVRLKLRDRMAETGVPLQTTKYAGTNALPNGLEGEADIEGTPKPVCLGNVQNVSAVLVNSAKNIYQVNDGAVSAITQVYDAGIPLSLGIITWTSRSSAASFNSVKFANGRFVAVGGTDGVSSAIYTSDDGTTWTSRTTSFGTSEIKDVAYGASTWVAVGYSGKIATSTDNGVTWTQRTQSTFGTDIIQSVAFGKGVFVATGGTATSLIATSPDGTTWTTRTSALTGVGGSVEFGNGVFVMTGVTGQVASSPTGTTWTGPHATSTAIFGANQVLRPCFGRDRFVVGDSSGNTATSLDGTSWTEAPNTGFATTSIWAAAYAFGFYFIVGSSSKMAVSTDGLSWVLQITNAAGTIFGVAGGVDTVVIVGTFGIRQAAGLSVYASEADLLDDAQAPELGTYGYYAAGGLLRLGAEAHGRVTADVEQSATASDHYAGQLFEQLLERAGFTASDWNATDVTDIDTAAPYELGYWANTETTVAAALDQVAASVGASWFVDRTGVFRIQQLVSPSGTPVLTLTANDLLEAPERITTNDRGGGLPTYQSLVRYAKNYTVQATDLAAGVSAARRNIVGTEWQTAEDSDTALLTAHPLAIQSVDTSLLVTAANAQSEATRRQSLYGVTRSCFEFVVQWNATTAALELNDVIEVIHDRFGLNVVGDVDVGGLFAVLGLAVNAKKRTLTITAWGPMGASNWVDDAGDYMVTDEGHYLVFEN